MGWAGVLPKNESNPASTGRGKFHLTASPDLQRLNLTELLIFLATNLLHPPLQKKINSRFELI